MKNRTRVFAAIIVSSIASAVGSSANGQQGWAEVQSIKLNDKPATLNSVLYNGEEVWIVGANGLILRSNDYGQTFNQIDVHADPGLNDIFGLKDRLWVIGDEGTMYFSTDRGQSFVKNVYTAYGRGRARQAGDPGSLPKDHLDLYSVQFVDEDRGYIVGDEGLILGSSDGGITWRELPSGSTSQLFNLSFRGKRGWVVGAGGLLIHTDDGGKNWYPQQSGSNEDLNRVVMVSEEQGFVTGEKGTLLRTENGGATWTRVSVRTDQSLYGISFLPDKKTGWVVGYGGTIIRTYDGGHNWVEQVSQTSADLFAVSFNKNRGFTIGRDGLVLRYFEKR
ncbi:MAG TPA: YCF48-related protein [Blastocatellia bacterium]|nr:YCF48-related protein [Blastocatellia bacterium]